MGLISRVSSRTYRGVAMWYEAIASGVALFAIWKIYELTGTGYNRQKYRGLTILELHQNTTVGAGIGTSSFKCMNATVTCKSILISLSGWTVSTGLLPKLRSLTAATNNTKQAKKCFHPLQN